MSVLEKDLGNGMQVRRNIDPGARPVPQGTVPVPQDGMWFVWCDCCGTLGTGLTGLYSNPTTAEAVARNHDRNIHGG